MAAITKQELEDAALDAETLQEVANEPASVNGTGIIVSRLGQSIKVVAKVIEDIGAFDFKGNWVTATSYVVKDLVEESGIVYVCLIAHTSGTFATDAAAGKWGVYQNGLTPDELAGIQGATTPLSAANLVMTVDDLPAAQLTADELAGIQGALTPLDAGNVIMTTDDLPADQLTADEVAGLRAATTPLDAANAVMTVDDLPAVVSALLAKCTLNIGDIGTGAGALTPTNATNVSSASKTVASGVLDIVTINFTAAVGTTYIVLVEYAESNAGWTINAANVQSKLTSSVVIALREVTTNTQNATITVTVLDASKL